MSNESTDDFLLGLRSFLSQKAKVPAPDRPRRLKQTIAALRPQLIELKDAGYSDANIAALLKEKGVNIGPGTLKNYMSQTRETTTAPELKPLRAMAALPDNRNVNTSNTKLSPDTPTPIAKKPTGVPGEHASLTRDPRKPL